MSKLTYSEVFEFIINHMNKTQSELAVDLGTSESTVSRIKAGKQFYLATVSPKDLYESVFQEKEQNLDLVKRFWTFLHDKKLSDDETLLVYYNENCLAEISSDIFRDFFMKVLDVAFSNGKARQKNKGQQGREKSEQENLHFAAQPDAFNPSDHMGTIQFDTVVGFARYHIESRDCFLGRDDLLKSVRETLLNNRTAIICGIGGLGKSFAADRYAEVYSNEYSQIQKVVFSSDIQETILKIPFDGLNETHFSTEDRIEKRFSILEGFGTDTLLIIDNMDLCPEDRENFERLKKMSLHVLFTSRETNMDSENYLVPIEPLSDENQLDLFKYHYGYSDLSGTEEEELLNLFHLVEGHTLLIEMIAKTMRESDLTAKEMAECLTERNYDSVSSISIEKDSHYQQGKIDNFVSNLFTTSQLNEEEKRILMLLSFSSVSGIRRRVFKELISCVNMDPINTLISKSWIVKDAGSHPSRFKIHLHPVIQTAVLNNTNPTYEVCKEYLSEAKAACENQALDSTDRADLLTILYRAGIMLKYHEQTVEALIEFAKLLFDAFQYKSSMELYDKAVSIVENINQEEIPLELNYKLYSGRGDNAVRLADYNKAISDFNLLTQKLKDSKQERPEESATVYNKLASVYRKASNYTQALDCFEEAKKILDESGIQNDRLYASIINDMGVVFINQDRLDEALKCYKDALQLRKSLDHPNEKELAYSYHNIGTVYQRKKMFDKAIMYHTIGLEKREQSCDENDPIIFASLVMIGNDYTKAAKADPEHFSFDDAFNYFQRGLQGRIKILGKSHPDTAWTYASIGDWYLYQGKYQSAIEEYQKCLEIRETVLGKSHAYTGKIHESLSKAYSAAGDPEKAEHEKQLADKIHAINNCN